MRVHLVYPQRAGSTIAPWAIGNNLLAMLVEAGHRVSWSDWDDCRAPATCDLLIGHPHPEPGRSFELAAATADRSIAICPYTPNHIPWLQGLLDRGLWHHLLAICGPEWQSSIPKDWPATRLDTAVEPNHWPRHEIPPSNRVLYVGCTLPAKGTDYLHAIATVAPDLEVHHVGPGAIPEPVHSHGCASGGQWWTLATLFPRIISCGVHDANPTAVLEGVTLGMTAFATRGAGWGEDLVVRIPDDDPEEAARILRETPLRPRFEAAEAYSWARFAATVLGCVDRS